MPTPRQLLTGRTIDPDALRGGFAPGSVTRGVRYAREGRIDAVDWPDESTLTGACRGSQGKRYRSRIGLRVVADGIGITGTDCSCPVGSYCKHVVALLLTVAGSGVEAGPATESPAPPRSALEAALTRSAAAGPGIADWRTVFHRMLDETAAVARPETGAPVGLQFSLTASGLHSPGGAVQLRPVTIGKRGAWIRTGVSWRDISFDGTGFGFDPAQYRAVRAVITDYEHNAGSYYADTIILRSAPASLWARLRDAVDAGVALVAEGPGLHTVELAKHAELRLDFTAADDGGADASAVLVIDGEPVDPAGAVLVGPPAPHGLHRIVDGVLWLAELDPPPTRALAELLGAGAVHIPAEHAVEFAAAILPQLTGTVPVQVPDGLFQPPTIVGPTPVLTIRPTATGAQAYWSVRYRVNDRRHDFDPNSAAGAVGYRDDTAEADAFTRLTAVLGAIAAGVPNWREQAVTDLRGRFRRTLDNTALAEADAITGAADLAAALAAARPATLRAPLQLSAIETAVLIGEVLPGLGEPAGWLLELDPATPAYRPAARAPQLGFHSDEGTDPGRTDWFGLDVTIDVDGHPVPLAEVIRHLSVGATHMFAADGVYFRLDTPELIRLRALLDEARALGEIDDGRVNAGSLNATLWEELLSLGVVDAQLAAWQQNLSRLAAARPPQPVPAPAGLAATLRDYQHDGLNWLAFLYDNGLGGILADDMGLGKTVQTLALISRAAAAGPVKFLVVAPTSVVGNWVSEAARFAPDLTAVAITGTDRRAAVPIAEAIAGADIVVTSYTLLRLDFDHYAAAGFTGVIFDEAQFVKNHNSKTHQCARRIEAGFKLAITGTPMENNLMELWALLSLTAPGLFPSPTAFAEYFRKPIESGTGADRLPVLRRRIRPVLLRRTKAQVVAELPAKQEQVLHLELGAKHRKAYDTRLARERQKVLGLLGDWEKNRFQIFRSLTLLRQLSLHPGLVDAADAAGGSAKVDFLVEQLPQLIAEGHQALVFSQFTGFLAILRAHLDAAGIGYSYLDGKVSAANRQRAIADFRGGANPVFLISLKAGGFGLNLTEADYCFVCDPWWSPAAEAQAVDRAHRIGQTRPVSVYRLVSAGTIEENVVALQQRKRELFDAVVDDGDLFGAAISADDVRDLLG